MEKVLLLLLLKGQILFSDKHLSLLNVKTKKEYAQKIFLQKNNQLLWSLCKGEIKSQHIPIHCWKLEKQWARYFLLKPAKKKSLLLLLDNLCTKNVTLFKKEKNLWKIDKKSLSDKCAKNIKYKVKTILYRRSY